MSGVQNPFDSEFAAQLYDKGRPFFHPMVIEKIRKKLGITRKVERALDVGCGTGLSSKALLEIAECVDAIDASSSMLAVAYRDPRITYRLMPAELIDSFDTSFDLITLSQTLHWTHQETFFQKAARLLRPNHSVVIYDDFFLWNADDATPFMNWFKKRYLIRFPTPPRNRIPLNSKGEFCPNGYALGGYEEYSYTESLTINRLIDYLVTQSNVIAAVERAGEPIGRATEWLENELPPFFASTSSVIFNFGGPVYYLTRI